MQLPNISQAVFHREGGLGLTGRFQDGQVPELGSAAWKDGSQPMAVSFCSDAGMVSSVVVRQLEPQPGDATGRWYTDRAGQHHWVELPAYGVVHPMSYMAAVRMHVDQDACAWAASKGLAHREALRLMETGTAPELETLLRYDYGRYQKTRSAYLVGSNTLGIAPLPADALTMPQKSPLPRIVTAQCDNVMSMYLAGLLRELVHSQDGLLTRRLLSHDAMDLHISYVALRILVEGSIWILCDKERRDRQNDGKDVSLQVRIQDSLNAILGAFCRGHQKTNVPAVLDSLPAKAAAYHRAMAGEAGAVAARGKEWTNALFWLPPLAVALGGGYQDKAVFRDSRGTMTI